MAAGMGVVLAVVVAAPVVAAAAGWVMRIPARVWGPSAAALSCLLAVVVCAVVVARGPVGWVVVNEQGRAVLGLQADQVAAVLLTLVCGIALVVAVFARRYLYGDAAVDRFYTGTALLATATTAMVCAVTLLGLAVAWTVAGIALCVLLGMYGQLPAARDGVRRTAAAFLIGDLALWAAVAVIVIRSGDLDLRPGQAAAWSAAAPAEVAMLGVLLVVAAASRSAQLPFHRWLPATLAAPTPVSALLHAGVVNAGAILLLRSGTVFGSSSVAMLAAFTVGASTVVYATMAMLTKPDVKGALAHSTMAQMGFMIMTCGLGLYAAAVFHLTAHAMYKATLFLGSGSAVHRHLRHRRAPAPAALTRPQRAAVGVFAVAVPAAVLAVAATLLPAVLPVTHDGDALLLFAWAVGAWASWGWLRRAPRLGRAAAAAAALLVALPAYLGALAWFTRFLTPALPPLGAAPAAAWLVLIAAAVLALVSVLRRRPPWPPGIAGVHDTLYVWALTHAHPAPGRRGRTGHAAGRRSPVTAAQPATIGAPA